MISLTPAAARQINGALEDEAEELSLRVAARLGEDGAIEYALGLDEAREGDIALDEKGVPLLIGASSQALLANTQIDFVEYEPGDFRFIFIAAQSDTAAAPAPPSGGCGSGGCSRCGSGS
jgi:iron-sulfur cluster assembly protein